MPNLLPQNNKKRIREEYIFRVVIIFLVFVFILLILSTAFLIPSYFVSENKAKLASDKITFLRSYLEERQKSGLIEEVLFTNEQVRVLSLPDSGQISQSIDRVLSKRSGAIQITNIVLRTINDEDGARKSLFVGGVASNRDRLISFSDSLRSTRDFLEVDLPISNLAKNQDIDFNIELKFLDN